MKKKKSDATCGSGFAVWGVGFAVWGVGVAVWGECPVRL